MKSPVLKRDPSVALLLSCHHEQGDDTMTSNFPGLPIHSLVADLEARLVAAFRNQGIKVERSDAGEPYVWLDKQLVYLRELAQDIERSRS